MSVLSSITTILPPPTYLRLPSIGVDISDTSLKYVQFSPNYHNAGSLILEAWGSVDIPANVLQRGMVTDVTALATAIKEVKDRTGIEMVRVSLPEERAYLFETEVKRGTRAKEIRGLLEFRLEENVPLSPREAFFDFEIAPSKDNSESLRVLVTVYARETIMNYFEACKIAGVTPISFEVEAQAIARATIPAHSQETQMIVDFGKTRTGVGIVHQGSLMYTSTIDIGGIQLSESLRARLGNIAESELTDIKNTQGLLPVPGSSDVREALLETVTTITDELRIRTQYWRTRTAGFENRQIDSLILCGGSVNMRGLPEYLTEKLQIPATRADVWKNVYPEQDVVPAIHRRYSYGYATAIGLGLGSYM